MKSIYAYFCDTHKCGHCSFPECAHTINEDHRMYKEENDKTEMRLINSYDGVNYYMEFIKHPFI